MQGVSQDKDQVGLPAGIQSQQLLAEGYMLVCNHYNLDLPGETVEPSVPYLVIDCISDVGMTGTIQGQGSGPHGRAKGINNLNVPLAAHVAGVFEREAVPAITDVRLAG
jgi:hypothetical protein